MDREEIIDILIRIRESGSDSLSKARQQLSGLRSEYDKFRQTLGNLSSDFKRGEQDLLRHTTLIAGLRGAFSGLKDTLELTISGFKRLGSSVLDALNPLNGGILKFAAVTALLLALSGALDTVVGALGGLAAGFIAGAAEAVTFVGLLKAAMSQLSDVMKAVQAQQQLNITASQRARQASIAHAQAVQSETSALHSLHDAQLNVVDAQKALVTARRDALRNLQDLILAEQQAKTAAEQSTYTLLGAQRSLASSIRSGDIGQTTQAEFSLESAQTGQSQALLNRGRAVSDANRARGLGVNNAQTVVQAKRALADAQFAQQQAASQLALLAKTSVYIDSAVQSYNNLVKNFTPAQKRLETSIEGLKSVYKNVAGRILTPILDSFTTISDNLTKVLKNPNVIAALEKASKAIAAALLEISNVIVGKQGQADLAKTINNMAGDVPKVADAVVKLMKAMRTIAVDVRQPLEYLLTLMGQFSSAVDKFVQSNKPGSVTKGGQFGDQVGITQRPNFFAESVKDLKSVGGVFGSILRVLQAIGNLPGGAKAGQNSLDDTSKALDKFASWLDGKGGQEIRSLLQNAKDFFKDAAGLLQGYTGFFGTGLEHHIEAAFVAALAARAVLGALTAVVKSAFSSIGGSVKSAATGAIANKVAIAFPLLSEFEAVRVFVVNWGGGNLVSTGENAAETGAASTGAAAGAAGDEAAAARFAPSILKSIGGAIAAASITALLYQHTPANVGHTPTGILDPFYGVAKGAVALGNVGPNLLTNGPSPNTTLQQIRQLGPHGSTLQPNNGQTPTVIADQSIAQVVAMFNRTADEIKKAHPKLLGPWKALWQAMHDAAQEAQKAQATQFAAFINSMLQGLNTSIQNVSAGVQKIAQAFGTSPGGVLAKGFQILGSLVPGFQAFAPLASHFAMGGPVGARAGGRPIIVGEGGHDEMVLTTDPRYESRTSKLMGEFIKRTGTLPRYATGGFVSGDPNIPAGAGFIERTPAGNVANNTKNFRHTPSSGGGYDAVDKAILKANEIEAHHYQYAWGGGHAHVGQPNLGTLHEHGGPVGLGYDCSGTVDSILYWAGLPYGSNAASYLSYGVPARSMTDGPIVTNSIGSHVIVAIDGQGFGTSATNPQGGAGWLPFNSLGGTMRKPAQALAPGHKNVHPIFSSATTNTTSPGLTSNATTSTAATTVTIPPFLKALLSNFTGAIGNLFGPPPSGLGAYTGIAAGLYTDVEQTIANVIQSASTTATANATTSSTASTATTGTPSKSKVIAAIQKAAKKWGLHAREMAAQASGESGLDPTNLGDYVGGSPTSFGLFQLHINGALGNISVKEAMKYLDPDLNAETAARQIATQLPAMKGLRGLQYLTAAVDQYERPSLHLRPGEIAKDYAWYQANPIKDLATGGIVRARPGGTLARLGEAGQDEAVVPLPKYAAGGIIPYLSHGSVPTGPPDPTGKISDASSAAGFTGPFASYMASLIDALTFKQLQPLFAGLVKTVHDVIKKSPDLSHVSDALQQLSDYFSFLDDAIARITRAAQTSLQNRLFSVKKVGGKLVASDKGRDQVALEGQQASSDLVASRNTYADLLKERTDASSALTDINKELKNPKLSAKAKQALEAAKNQFEQKLLSLGDALSDAAKAIYDAQTALQQAAIDKVNQTAQNRYRQIGLKERVDALGGSALRSLVAQGGDLNLQGGALQSELTAQQKVLASTTDPTLRKQIADRIDELNTELKENGDAIRQNTEAVSQAKIDQITALQGFVDGIAQAGLHIADTLNQITGSSSTTLQRQVLGFQGQQLGITGSGLADQLQQLFGINVHGLSGSSLVSKITGLNLSQIEGGLDDTQKSQFEDLINAILANTGSQLDNTEQLKELSQIQIQTFSSTAWETFRTAVFNGMGQLQPQYHIPGAAAGGYIAQGGLLRVHTGEMVVPAKVVNQNGTGWGGDMHIHNYDAPVDPAYISKRLAFELKGSGR